MISRPTALARAMSEPTSRPSHRSAHSRRAGAPGIDRNSRRPVRTPFRRWWKKIGCVSRALLPHRRTRSVSSASRYELVPPPAPNTVARPATEGACQVRLQLSMLLLPMTTRLNFCAAKFISFVAFEQLKTPNVRARARPPPPEAGRRAIQRLVPAGWAQDTGAAVAVADERRGQPEIFLRHRVLLLRGPTARV